MGSLTILTSWVGPAQALEIVHRLSSLFTVSPPEVVFDTNMAAKYNAFCWPESNEIHFRNEWSLRWDTPFHEFAHILFYDYYRSTDQEKSESFARAFERMSLTNGEDLLNFICEGCGNSAVVLQPDGLLRCQVCNSLYAIYVPW
jgi:hypothetical protein